jgi:hypothetical protein
MTAIIEALSRLLASFMEWWQQRNLMQAGRNEVLLENAEKTISTQEKLLEIDRTELPSDPQSILNKL